MTVAALERNEYSDHDVIDVSNPSAYPASARRALAPSMSCAAIGELRAAQKLGGKISTTAVPRPKTHDSIIGARSIAMEIAWRTRTSLNGSRVRLKPRKRMLVFASPAIVNPSV